MSADRGYVRLGLFAVVSAAALIVTVLFFAQRMRSRDVIPMVTYTSENVSGLDVSSPVRYRGVAVGRVSGLRIDPSGNTIQIDFEIFQDRLLSVGADLTRVQAMAAERVFPSMRAQIIGNPVTGEAYLLLHVPKNPPPPMALGFTPDRPYVASMPSPMTALQDRAPAVLERAEATLQTVSAIIARIPDSLDRSDRFFTNVERIVRESRLPELSADSRDFFSTTTERIDRMTGDVERLLGPDGAFAAFTEEARAALRDADLPASSESTREAMARTVLAVEDVRRTLPAIRDALEQLRELGQQLEAEPESVVHGPRPTGRTRR